MFRTCIALAVFIGSAVPALAAPPSKPDPNPKSLEVPADKLTEARELVQKLGSEVFAEREAAERELAEMGRLARPALLDGINDDPDPEIRARCRVLLPKANAEEMAARLDAFMADTSGKYEHDLPGWHKLRATVRGEWTLLGHTFAARPDTDKAARELFIEFIKAPGGRQLLNALGGQPGDLGQLVAVRKTELYRARFPQNGGTPVRVPAAAEVAVVVFAESQVHSRNVPRATALTSVISTSGLTTAVQGTDDRALALRAVMTGWLDSRTDPVDMYTALNLSNTMRLDAPAARLAGRMMSTPGLQTYYKTQALNTLVRLKPLEQLSALEAAFTDTGALTTTIKIVGGMQVREAVEVRDGALVAAILMTGQNPGDYGFEAYANGVAGLNFSPTWAKISDDGRKAAMEKWKAWREKGR